MIQARLGAGVTAITVLVLVVFALALVTGSLYYLISRTQGIADAFRPRVNSKVILSGTIDRLQSEGKIVVLTADVTAETESSTDKEIFFGLLDVGTTTVRVRAPARVQYFIPLDGISREDFVFDPSTRRLVITIPNPRIDSSIVQVSTDPAEIEVTKDIGWLRLDAFSGRYNERRARRLLRDAAIHAGVSGYWLPRAQESADQALRRLLVPLIGELREDVQLTFAFRDDGWDHRGEEDALPRPRPRE